MRMLPALALTALISVTAAAQDPKHLEFTVYGGLTHVGTKPTSYGEGPAIGGAVEFRPFPWLGFAGNIQRSNHSATITNSTFSTEHRDVEGHFLDTSAGVVYHLYKIHLEPFISGEVGSIHTVRSERSRSDEHENIGPLCFTPGCKVITIVPASVGPWSKHDQTQTALHASIGVYIPVASRFSLRPELRLIRSKDIRSINALVGLSYRR
jgi:hypothetical protein